MAYDEALAEQVRTALAVWPGVSERRMFGGLAFVLDGRMACGVAGDELMLRLGPDGAERALAEPHVRPMDFTGRPLSGMVFVTPEALHPPESVKEWVTRAAEFVATFPPKP